MIREYTYAFAAVSPRDGRVVSLVLPWADAATMSLFLTHVATEFPDDYCLVVLDGAGWHVANELRIPSRIKLIALPPYSPELNPTEQLWEHLREHYFGNLVFASLEDVALHLCHALRDLDAKQDQIRSMTTYEWFKTLPLMAI